MLPLIFFEVDMILFENSVLKMYLLNTHLNFYINSFSYLILFNLSEVYDKNINT